MPSTKVYFLLFWIARLYHVTVINQFRPVWQSVLASLEHKPEKIKISKLFGIMSASSIDQRYKSSVPYYSDALAIQRGTTTEEIIDLNLEPFEVKMAVKFYSLYVN